MAQTNNQAFYVESLKALKLMGEKSPVGSDERLMYSVKANSLRDTLKKMGYLNVDADYGAGVALANTPGGGKIDWNVLSNAADILGSAPSTSTRSSFDRALGEYLTRNLPAWQKASAAQPASASSTITSTATPVMGGGSAAANITGGGVNFKPQETGTVATGTPTQTAATTPTAPVSTMGAVAPTGTGAGGYGTIPGVANGSVYGQFIQSQYFKNNDFLGWATQQGVDLPFTTNTSGTKIFDSTKASGTQLAWYNNNFKIWNQVQSLSQDALTLADPASIEKNPAFLTQVDVLSASIKAQIGQNSAAIDAQVAGLAGQQESAKAGLKFQIDTIKREVASADWRSRQSLAASGMAFTGMLGYLYGQNGAAGGTQIASATAQTGASLVALGNQMAILTASKLTFANDLDVLKTTQLAALRASILDPQNKTWQSINDMATAAITQLTGETGTANVQFEAGYRTDVATAAQANFDTAVALAKLGKQGIWVTPSADGKSYTWTTGLTDAEQTARDSALFDQWYKTEGLNLDWAAQDLSTAKQKFSEWATTQGLTLDNAKLGLEWAKLAETARSNKASEGISQQNANTAAGGGTVVSGIFKTTKDALTWKNDYESLQGYLATLSGTPGTTAITGMDAATAALLTQYGGGAKWTVDSLQTYLTTNKAIYDKAVSYINSAGGIGGAGNETGGALTSTTSSPLINQNIKDTLVEMETNGWPITKADFYAAKQQAFNTYTANGRVPSDAERQYLSDLDNFYDSWNWQS